MIHLIGFTVLILLMIYVTTQDFINPINAHQSLKEAHHESTVRKKQNISIQQVLTPCWMTRISSRRSTCTIFPTWKAPTWTRCARSGRRPRRTAASPCWKTWKSWPRQTPWSLLIASRAWPCRTATRACARWPSACCGNRKTRSWSRYSSENAHDDPDATCARRQPLRWGMFVYLGELEEFSEELLPPGGRPADRGGERHDDFQVRRRALEVAGLLRPPGSAAR